jgi:hypothetical protein
MQADFSRDTFDPAKHFSAVLSQQGRVQLDADANEQAAILLHQLRIAVADVIGPAGAPVGHAGLGIGAIAGTNEDLAISDGRFYVDGVLVENDTATTYLTQPYGYLDEEDVDDQLPVQSPYVVYLRVWERLVTAVQDPTIREVALGDPGPDTAARAQVIWQVATLPVQVDSVEGASREFGDWLLTVGTTGLLRADANRPDDSDEKPCHIPPAARFRGQENQLYRVEVHTGGVAASTGGGTASARRKGSTSPRSVDGATFKWSRENASVVFPVESVSGAVVALATLGRDGKLDLEVGDLVEVTDDAVAARVADDVVLTDVRKHAPALRRVLAIDAAARTVTLDGEADGCDVGTSPLLRRWDHGSSPDVVADGALPIREGVWFDLEDGVQVYFEPGGKDPSTYRRGDYWLIPARTAIGDVLWPHGDGGSLAKAPDGVRYHYAPLAFVLNGKVDLTPYHVFAPLQAPAKAASSKSRAAQTSR